MFAVSRRNTKVLVQVSLQSGVLYKLWGGGKKVIRRFGNCFGHAFALRGPLPSASPYFAARWWQSLVYGPNGANLSLEQGGVTLLKLANCLPVSADGWFFLPFPPFPLPSIIIQRLPQ